LIPESQFLVFQRANHGCQHDASCIGQAIQLDIVEVITVFPAAFCRIHRRIGLAYQGGCIRAIGGEQRNADAPRYFRPTEVETLLGDPSKAKEKLGWTPKISFDELVAEMVREDLKSAERDELVKKHGYKTMDYNE